MKSQIQLPLELEPWRVKFESTIRSFIKVIPGEAGPTTWWQSKTGGLPYLPKGVEFPTTLEGKELFFLAQINFTEVPRLRPFPESGILQFYINDDEWYGADPLHPSSGYNFRVLYFEQVLTDEKLLERDFSWLRNYNDLPLDPDKSYPLEFELQEEVVPLSDYQFVKLLGDDFFVPFGDRQWEIMDAYTKMNNSGGHKMGGYAFFAQQDPRYRLTEPLGSSWELLFQLDSDPRINCMWGDMGVGNFFIRKNELTSLDFSKVMYHWDAY